MDDIDTAWQLTRIAWPALDTCAYRYDTHKDLCMYIRLCIAAEGV